MLYTDKYFSFPPYLSTSWDQVASLQMNAEGQLVFHLKQGEPITLPPLPPQEIEKIFQVHASYLDKQGTRDLRRVRLPEGQEMPIRFALGNMGGMEGMQGMMMHNPAQSNSPALPEEMLEKVGQIARIVGPSDPAQMPKAEPHCNCFYCQIARAIQGEPPVHLEVESSPAEEVVSEKDLAFQDWEITQTGDKLYNVVSKLNSQERYSVYLGNPVGCTCGKPNCEHILVVLRS